MSAAWLTAGMTVWAVITNSVPGMGTGARRPVASGSPSRLRMKRTPLDVAVLVADDLDGADQELHAHAFALGLAQLLLVDDELGAGAAVGDGHVRGAVAEAGARAVHGGVAAADDDDVVPDLERLAQVGLLHEVDAVLDAVEVAAGHVQPTGVHGARRRWRWRRSRSWSCSKVMSRPMRVSYRKRHAQPLDQAEVHLDGLARQAEGGHADEHRAARVGQLVEDRHLVAGDGQLARDGDAGRPGADDRDGRVARRDERHVVGDAGGLVPLDEEALHGPDGQRPVDVAAAAGPLAGRRADVGAHRRDRVGLAREDVALLEAALGGEVQVAAAVRADRARFLALDVALEPGGVDRLDEEFLVDGHGQVRCLSDALGCEVGGPCGQARIYHPSLSPRAVGGRTRPPTVAGDHPPGGRDTAYGPVRLTPRVVAATLAATMRAAQPGPIRTDR